MNLAKIKELLKSQKLRKYFLSGGLAFIVDTTTFFLFRKFTNYSIPLSNSIAISFGSITSFTLNHIWVFEHKIHARHTSKRGILFTVNVIIGYLFSTLVIHLVSDRFAHTKFYSHITLIELIAKIGALFIIVFWNFYIYKKLIFKELVE